MSNRRTYRGEFHHHQEFHGTRSYNNRKTHQGRWQLSVPSWEKKFCYSVGSVPWKKVLETKRYMHIYENILKWNDCAVEEAFYDAKRRYWAEINGQSCNISLPDPNIYIDEVDWDANVDPELLLDLERETKESDASNKGEQVVIIGNTLMAYQSFSPTGWGDAEDDFNEAANKKMDAGSWEHDQNAENNQCHLAVGGNNGYGDEWEIGWKDSYGKVSNCRAEPTYHNDRNWGNNGYREGWAIGWNESFGKENDGGNDYDDEFYNKNNLYGGSWVRWEGGARQITRYKTKRYPDNHNMDLRWRANGYVRL